MKKLAIMFVMLLGSVATMQAQSFDFSCHDDITDNSNDGNDFGTVFEDISDGFTSTEMAYITNSGFTTELTDNGNEILVQYVENPVFTFSNGNNYTFPGVVRMSVRFGTFYNDDGDQREGASRGPWAYHIIGTRAEGSNDYSNDKAEVIAWLLAAAINGRQLAPQEIEVRDWNVGQDDQIVWSVAMGGGNFLIASSSYSIEYSSSLGWYAVDDAEGSIEGTSPYSLAELMIAVLALHNN